MKKKENPAAQHFEKLRHLASQRTSRFQGMSLEKVITILRKSREALWEKKLAARS